MKFLIAPRFAPLIAPLIAMGIGAGVAVAGVDTSTSVPAATSKVSGRVTFVGTVPPAGASKVKFKGEKPEAEKLTIEASKSEGCTHGDAAMDATDRSLLISDDGGLANVVVMVEVDGEKPKVPDAPVVLDQKSCRFEPHVTVVGMGTTVRYANGDGISHNVHTYAAKNDNFNQMIGSGSNHSMTYDKADQVKITCDIHPWMSSYLVVTDAPYFAVTGADGSFTLPKLPAGTHQVAYWHETLGKNKGEIVVGDDGSAAPITLEWGDEKKSSRGRRR